MWRRILNVLAAVSFLLCVTGTYLWLWVPYGPWPNPFYQPIGDIGSKSFYAFPNAQGLRIHYVSAPPQAPRSAVERHLCGFHFQSFDIAAGRLTVVVLPTWFLLPLTAALPALWVRNFVRTLRRPGPGCCAACGYDLRATPDRCPECGAVPKPPHHPQMQRTATGSSGAVE